MATAKKLPSGMWRCQASVDGERRSFTAHTKKEAEFLALEWQTRRKEKRNPDHFTIGEVIENALKAEGAKTCEHRKITSFMFLWLTDLVLRGAICLE